MTTPPPVPSPAPPTDLRALFPTGFRNDRAPAGQQAAEFCPIGNRLRPLRNPLAEQRRTSPPRLTFQAPGPTTCMPGGSRPPCARR